MWKVCFQYAFGGHDFFWGGEGGTENLRYHLGLELNFEPEKHFFFITYFSCKYLTRFQLSSFIRLIALISISGITLHVHTMLNFISRVYE